MPPTDPTTTTPAEGPNPGLGSPVLLPGAAPITTDTGSEPDPHPLRHGQPGSARTTSTALTGTPGTTPSTRRRPPRVLAALIATTAIAALLATATTDGPDGGRHHHSAVSKPGTANSRRNAGAQHPDANVPADTCPPVDSGCHPIPLRDGIFEADGKRWRLSDPSDIVAVGRWTCTGALVGALDPRTGQIWVFPTWTTSTSTATAVAIVPGATSLRAAPRRSGCDLIAITRQHAPTLLVDPLPELTGNA